MCGRYTLSSPVEVLIDHFQVEEAPEALEPRYNIAPSTECPVVGQAPEGHRKIRMLRWGLIPSWAKDRKMAFKMINARAETVATKPAYRTPFKKRRVLVPCDGFYEWKTIDGKKQPFLIRAADEKPLAFAGIWERWKDPEAGENVDTFSVLTTEAGPDIAELHHRQPVILTRDDWDLWLDREMQDRDALEPLLGPSEAGRLIFHAVSRKVGNVRNDSADLLDPVEL